MFDALLAAYLLNPSRDDYAPDELAHIYLGESIPAESGAGGQRRAAPKMDGNSAFPARGPIRSKVSGALQKLYEPMRQKIAVQGMQPLYEQIELPLAQVLASMELWGIRVDLFSAGHIWRVFEG